VPQWADESLPDNALNVIDPDEVADDCKVFRPISEKRIWDGWFYTNQYGQTRRVF
jgi:hypothetical protein